MHQYNKLHIYKKNHVFDHLKKVLALNHLLQFSLQYKAPFTFTGLPRMQL